jgi:hypothetical protein
VPTALVCHPRIAPHGDYRVETQFCGDERDQDAEGLLRPVAHDEGGDLFGTPTLRDVHEWQRRHWRQTCGEQDEHDEQRTPDEAQTASE